MLLVHVQYIPQPQPLLLIRGAYFELDNMPPNTLGMLFLLNHLTTRTSHSCSVVCLYMYCMLSTCMQRSYGSRDIALTMHSDINISKRFMQCHYNPHTPHTVSNRPLREFILYTVSLVFNIRRNGCFSNLEYQSQLCINKGHCVGYGTMLRQILELCLLYLCLFAPGGVCVCAMRLGIQQVWVKEFLTSNQLIAISRVPTASLECL